MNTKPSLVGNSAQIIYSAAKNLINLSETYQLEFKDKLNANVQALHFIKEFRTVKICGPRQSGHTTAIQWLTHEYLKPCVITWNLDIANTTIKQVSQQTKLVTVHSLDRIRGQRFDIIFVDTSSLLSSKKLDEIYETCTPCLFKIPSCIVFME